MSLAVDDPPSAAPPPGGPWSELLTRIADETELDGSARVAGDLVHARYFRAAPSLHGPNPTAGRTGGTTCTRLAVALRQRFLGRDGWTLRYRSEAGVPVFAVTAAGRPAGPAASCFLDLTPVIAPEAFARLVTTLEGYGLGFRAELRGDAGDPERLGTAVVTVARAHAAALARVVLRMRERAPVMFGPTVAPFTRPLAPGIGLADEPGDGTEFGRHRCRVIASGLVAAGPGARPAERRAAVLAALTAAGLDPAVLHLDPGHPEFRLG